MIKDERVKVVVVDDHRDMADNLAELLVLEGFDARAAYGGSEAIELVSKFSPECILFDIAMPGVDGLQLAGHLRNAHRDDIVLLAMTGNVEDARVADTFAVVDHYFAKPFEISALLKVLRPMRWLSAPLPAVSALPLGDRTVSVECRTQRAAVDRKWCR